ncbi:DEAD/DEAH box helicase [Nitriliruptor alkaliphilus]|uniref:DEAD/DEAH box helicase n=1 Tax=Nitriliruptor alkaliphilus TaxID=427918 RepID=UPI000698676C|nr:DEAD/DEAH box helicase [Nitriliruptor alkaliphilus]
MTDHALLGAFEASLGFSPDPFQRRAIDALLAGRSVLVAAPTGAGKTVVGEFACHEALRTGGRAFYTTPIKALSNQKHRDLTQVYGEANVGLLTGDRSVNGDAPVVVMTTEVLRNMIYEASPALDDLRSVVLDEVHFLADRSRGAVWEEVIIQLDTRVKLAALSATVSNAEDVGRWLDEVRDGCEVVIEEHRPVPLRHHYFVNQTVHDTFRAGRKGGATREHREAASQALGGVPNPDVLMLERRARTRNRVSNKGRRQGPDVRLRWPSRPQVVEELAERRWLPAILFVFSRQGCEDAVAQLRVAGVRLTSEQEREEIAAIVDSMVGDLPDGDLRVLGFPTWRAGLIDGIAAHHAGMVPAFKEVVEVLFQRNLLKVVVATETLALGINMPARTVVIERLEKWNGESHVLLTPGEYTQLTGRAGRRGIDRVGHAVVLYQRDLDFRTVAGLVGTRTYPLHSSFAPSYNMAVNLLRRHDLREAEDLLGASFAQFEADASVARTTERLTELEEGMAGYARHLACHLGDWPAYWARRREVSRREKREAKERRHAASDRIRTAIAGLQPGDVLHLPWLGKRGLAAVVGVHLTKKGTPIAQLVVDDKSLTKLGPRELEHPPVPVERLRLPGAGNPRQSAYRQELGVSLRQLDPPGLDVADLPRDPQQDRGPSAEVVALHEQVRTDPCHGCPDRSEHERWQYRYDELDDEARDLRQRVSARTGNLVRQLHRILRVLADLGYVADPDGLPPGDRGSWDPEPTDAGRTLAGIYSEVDLLVAEALRRGLLDDLEPDELAGVAALFLYTPRGGDPTEDAELPTLRLYEVTEDLMDLADELRGREQAAGLRPLRDLDAGFVAPAWRWAGGASLDDALGRLELTGGDFVRNVKQVADLVGQLRSVGDDQLAKAADTALDGLRRGIVES